MKRALVGLIGVVGICIGVSANGLEVWPLGPDSSFGVLSNDCGEVVTGLEITFSEPVVLRQQLCIGGQLEVARDDGWRFELSGAVVPQGTFEFIWEPSTSHVTAAQWIVAGSGTEAGRRVAIDVKTPTARIRVTGRTVGEPVVFRAVVPSSPGGGDIVRYLWDWDDGVTADGAVAARTYSAAGTHHVRLTVWDTKGGCGTAARAFAVRAPRDVPPPPTPELTPVATLVGLLPYGLTCLAGAVYDGAIYIMGGHSAPIEGVSNLHHEVLRIDCTTWEVSVLGEFQAGVWWSGGRTAAAANDTILFVPHGGEVLWVSPSEEPDYSPGTALQSSVLFGQGVHGWLGTPNDVVALNNRLYSAGYGGVYEFDPSTGAARCIGALPRPDSYMHSLAVLGDRIYVLGGYQSWGDSLGDVIEVDPVANTVELIGQMPHASHNFAAAVAVEPDRIYLVAGSRFESGSELEQYHNTMELTLGGSGATVVTSVLPNFRIETSVDVDLNSAPWHGLGTRWAYVGYVDGKIVCVGGETPTLYPSDGIYTLEFPSGQE